MLFNSLEFVLFFLPLTIIVYFLLNKYKLITIATSWLIFSSLFLYSCWKPEYLFLILFSIIFNYAIGSTLSSNNNLKINKKVLYLSGICGNILLLVGFKYFGFLISSINNVFFTEFNIATILVPLGIGFLTIQQIMYLTECLNQKFQNNDFLSYSLYITFFPKLIAGPLVRYEDINNQFAKLKNRIFNPKNFSIGLLLFSIGLFQKVLIADYLSPFVKQIFDIIDKPSLIEMWTGAFAYTFEMFFNFSGYINMALGIGYMFNIILPQNFNYPYLAQNIYEFWNRWNITFTDFLKTNIYKPLENNSNDKTYRNIMITSFVAGIWYGANITFVIWGLLHGIALCIYKHWLTLNRQINQKLAKSITFLFVVMTFVIFRADSVARFVNLLKSLIGINGIGTIGFDKFRICFENGTLTISIFLILLAIYMTFFMKKPYLIALDVKPKKYYIFLTLILLIVSIMNLNNTTNSIYGLF